MFTRFFGKQDRYYHDHSKDPKGPSSFHSASPDHEEWASSHFESNHHHHHGDDFGRALVLTTPDNKTVLSLYVEIDHCRNLASAHDMAHMVDDACDPYVKVKLAHKKPEVTIHKTKFVTRTNNPDFQIMHHQSAFCIDGLSVEDLNAAQGLLIKVKQHGTKEELGHVHLTTSHLLHIVKNAAATESSVELELIHPTKLLPGLCGTIAIKVRPAEPQDIKYYKSKGQGYFQDYTMVEPQPSAILETTTSSDMEGETGLGNNKKDDKVAPKLELDSDNESADDNSHPLEAVKEEPYTANSNSGVIGGFFRWLTGGGGGQSSPDNNQQHHHHHHHHVVKVHTITTTTTTNTTTTHANPNNHGDADTVSSTVASLADSPALKPHHPGMFDAVRRLSGAMVAPHFSQEEIEKERIQIFHPFDEAEKAIEQERMKLFHKDQMKNGAGSSKPTSGGGAIEDPYLQGAREDAADARKFGCGGDNCNNCVIL